jgi:HEPN domain-containing protein
LSHTVWLEQATDDLQAARVLSAASHHSQAVWLAAQAVEKAHKAVLLALGLRYEDRHFKQLGHSISEISKLLPEALLKPYDLTIAMKVTALEAWALSSRYPAPVDVAGTKRLLAPSSRITSSQQEIEDAGLLLEWCRERITRAVAAVQAMTPP